MLGSKSIEPESMTSSEPTVRFMPDLTLQLQNFLTGNILKMLPPLRYYYFPKNCPDVGDRTVVGCTRICMDFVAHTYGPHILDDTSRNHRYRVCCKNFTTPLTFSTKESDSDWVQSECPKDSRLETASIILSTQLNRGILVEDVLVFRDEKNVWILKHYKVSIDKDSEEFTCDSQAMFVSQNCEVLKLCFELCREPETYNWLEKIRRIHTIEALDNFMRNDAKHVLSAYRSRQLAIWCQQDPSVALTAAREILKNEKYSFPSQLLFTIEFRHKHFFTSVQINGNGSSSSYITSQDGPNASRQKISSEKMIGWNMTMETRINPGHLPIQIFEEKFGYSTEYSAVITSPAQDDRTLVTREQFVAGDEENTRELKRLFGTQSPELLRVRQKQRLSRAGLGVIALLGVHGIMRRNRKAITPASQADDQILQASNILGAI